MTDVYGKATILPPHDPRHGTENGYSNLGCRCQPCRDAWAMTVWERKRRRPALAPDDPRHGRENAYSNFNCRCRPCKDAHNAAISRRRRAARERRHAVRTAGA